MKAKICISLLLVWHLLQAQNEGNKWVIGYYGFGDHDYSIMHLDFTGNEMQIEYHFNEAMQISETCSNICDSKGDAILWTNGMQLFGKHGQYIADTIAFDGLEFGYWNWFYTPDYGPLGFPEPDGAIILPVPNKTNEYSVLYHSALPHPELIFQINKILEARVKMRSDTSFELVYKDSLVGPVLQWYTGPILSTKHANGRDWWIVLFESDSPNYFIYLLTPEGIHLSHTGSVDTLVKGGFGQAVFSSKGNFIARLDAITDIEGQYITLYSFDRCNGDLNRLETFHTTTGNYTGLAFSPSEQYLYADDNSNLWQWDLLSTNIKQSQSLVDTFDGFVQPGWFQMRFGPMKLAPDGKIYIIPSAGSSEFMHVIERPDLPYNECHFRQHSINLTKPNGRSAPNLPNFRLGPLDGSNCDSLGINNIPVAKFRYEDENENDSQLIRFTDQSYFEPTEWLWDFGDGSTSTVENPIHLFDKGVYKVCLTVSNSYGIDNYCQTLEIFTTKTLLPNQTPFKIMVYPNPFDDFIHLEPEGGDFRNIIMDLYDPFGRSLMHNVDLIIPSNLYLTKLPSGTYLLKIEDGLRRFTYVIIKR